MRRSLASFFATGMVVLCWTASAVASVPYGIQPNAHVLHLAFHQVPGGTVRHCGTVITNGDDALVPLSAAGSANCPRFAVINDRTHVRIDLPRRALQAVLAFDPPRVLLQMTDRRILFYDMNTGRTTLCGGPCSIGDRQPLSDSLGSQWLAVSSEGYGSCGDGLHNVCGPDDTKYYNLTTHKVRRNVTVASGSVIDLNSPRLIVPLCRPNTSTLSLAAPTGGPDLAGVFGRFLLTGFGPYTVSRCGGGTAYTIADSGQHTVFGNPHILLWPPYESPAVSTWLEGLELPSVTPVAFPLPSDVVDSGPGSAIVDNEALYVVTSDGQILSARLPSDHGS